MTDPVLRVNGNFLELEFYGHTKYIKKDTITQMTSTPHRLLISLSGKTDPEGVSFSTREKQAVFMANIIAGISEKDTAAQHVIAKMNKDLADCVRLITEKLKKFKEDLHLELKVELDLVKGLYGALTESLKLVEVRLDTVAEPSAETSTEESAEESQEEYRDPEDEKNYFVNQDTNEDSNICLFTLFGSVLVSLFTTLGVASIQSSLTHHS